MAKNIDPFSRINPMYFIALSQQIFWRSTAPLRMEQPFFHKCRGLIQKATFDIIGSRVGQLLRPNRILKIFKTSIFLLSAEGFQSWDPWFQSPVARVNHTKMFCKIVICEFQNKIYLTKALQTHTCYQLYPLTIFRPDVTF